MLHIGVSHAHRDVASSEWQVLLLPPPPLPLKRVCRLSAPPSVALPCCRRARRLCRRCCCCRRRLRRRRAHRRGSETRQRGNIFESSRGHQSTDEALLRNRETEEGRTERTWCFLRGVCDWPKVARVTCVVSGPLAHDAHKDGDCGRRTDHDVRLARD